jgi:hypothetical protein
MDSVLRKEEGDSLQLRAKCVVADVVAGVPTPPGKGEGEIRACIIAFEAGEVAGVVKLLGVHG